MKNKTKVKGECRSGLNNWGRIFCGLLASAMAMHLGATPMQGVEHSERSASRHLMRADALSIEKAPIGNTTLPNPVASVVPPNALTVSQDLPITSAGLDLLYGSSLEMDGDRLAVGAVAGVHIYRSVAGQWIKEARLSNRGQDYFVVRALSISGDLVAYGEGGSAPGDELYNNNNGSISIYNAAGGTWRKEAEIFDENDEGNGEFGYSVSLDLDRMVAGGVGTSRSSGSDRRTPIVNVYLRENAQWIKKTTILLSELVGYGNGPQATSWTISKLVLKDGFIFVSDNNYANSLRILVERQDGWAIDSSIPATCNACFAYRDGVLVVDRSSYVRKSNAWVIDSVLPQGSGAVAFDGHTLAYASGHIYSRVGSSWVQKSPISSASTSVAVSAQGMTRSSAGSATAVVYRAAANSWTQAQILVPENGDNRARFGNSVSMIGDSAVIGAPYEDFYGAAYVVNHSAERWSVIAKLVPDVRDFYSGYGYRVSFSSEYAAVGDNPYCEFANENRSIYLFKKTINGWTQDARIKSPGSDGGSSCSSSRFGDSFAIAGSMLAVTGIDGTYIYERDASSWNLRTVVSAQQLGLVSAKYSQSAVDLFGDTIAVLSSGIDTTTKNQRNSVDIFRIEGGRLTRQKRLDFPKVVGFSIATNVLATLLDGVVTMYGRTGETWKLLSTLTSTADGNSTFSSVKVSGGVLAVQLSSGSVELYTRKGDIWIRKAELAASGVLEKPYSYLLPASISVSGERVLVGDQFFSDFANFGGAVRSYTIASDYGDAPDGYRTLRANGGARHFIDGPRLGTRIDADEDGHPSSGATGDDIAGDDDEDGVTFPSLAVGSRSSLQTIVSNGPAKIDAWVDFDGDGTFSASERIATGSAAVSGTSQLSFNVPATSRVGQTYARVRVSSDGAAGPNATVVDGEVEDELVSIKALSLSISDASVIEGSSGTRLMTFEVTANAAPLVAAIVKFSTADGTAVAGVDYVSQSGTINFEPGETRKTISVVVNGDINAEVNENFQVGLSNPSGISIARNIGIGTITDDDSAAEVPAITVNVKRFNFGNVAVGSKSVARSLIVTSSGSAPLEINAIRIAGDYSGTSKCPKLLAPGATCELTGTFAPKARGVRAGSVTLTTNAPSGPTVIELTGTGT